MGRTGQPPGMLSRRRYVAALAVALSAGCGDGASDSDGGDGESGGDGTAGDGDGQGGDDSGLDDATPDEQRGTADAGMQVSTPAWEDGGDIPEQYTADGENVSPPLTVESVPEDAETLAVIANDPDADGFVHWLLWNVPADVSEIPEGVPNEETVSDLDGASQGTNGFGEIGYGGPSPPEDDDPHRYRFAVHALETELDVEPGAERDALEDVMDGRIVDSDEVAGQYGR